MFKKDSALIFALFLLGVIGLIFITMVSRSDNKGISMSSIGNNSYIICIRTDLSYDATKALIIESLGEHLITKEN